MRPLKILFSLLAAAGASIAQAQEIHPRIINGGTVAEGRYPWMASLHLSGSQPTDILGGHSCAAFLVHPRFLLTSAHCVYSQRLTPSNLAVTVGRTRLSNAAAGVTVPIAGVQIHPQYNDTSLDFDVAIVRLNTAVNSIAPVRIIYPGASGAQSGSGAIMGWGTTTGGMTAEFYTDVMREAVIPIPSESACSAAMLTYFHPANMLCAGKLATNSTSGDGIDGCYGDSGDPLLSTLASGGERVVGISSWGYECASHEYYGVYARLDAAAEWIYSNVPIPPAPLISPALSGGMRAGEAAQCSSGTWDTGAGTFTYLFETEAGATLSSGASSSYQLKSADAGKKIRCTVTNSLGGVEGAAASPLYGPVLPAVTPPTPTPTPTPTATPTPPGTGGSGDTNAPKITFAKKFCSALKCVVLVEAKDAVRGVVSGVDSITFEATWSGKSCSIPAGETRPRCVRVQSAVPLLASEKPIPSFNSFGLNAPAKGRITAQIQAIDKAGNRSKIRRYSWTVRE